LHVGCASAATPRTFEDVVLSFPFFFFFTFKFYDLSFI
jgi:hypothetical protein